MEKKVSKGPSKAKPVPAARRSGAPVSVGTPISKVGTEGAPKRRKPPQSNRPKTSVPLLDKLIQKAGWIEAALEVHKSTDSESVKAHAAKWIQIVLEWLDNGQSHLPLIQGVSTLSHRQMVVLGLEIFAGSLSQFWPWYSNHIEFACELIAAITRWESCRGDSSEERI